MLGTTLLIFLLCLFVHDGPLYSQDSALQEESHMVSLIGDKQCKKPLSSQDSLNWETFIQQVTKIEVVSIKYTFLQKTGDSSIYIESESAATYDDWRVDKSQSYDGYYISRPNKFTIDTNRIGPGVKLDSFTWKKLPELLYGYKNPLVMDLCYLPRYGLIFYKNSDTLAYVEFCGQCSQLRSSGPPFPYVSENICHDQNEALKVFFRQVISYQPELYVPLGLSRKEEKQYRRLREGK